MDYIVSVRGGFSDRMGIHKENTTLQMSSLDSRSRVAIYNFINNLYHKTFKDFPLDAAPFWRSVMANVYNQPVDYGNDYFNKSEMFRIIKVTIEKDGYGSVLTLFEYMINRLVSIYEEHGAGVNKVVSRLVNNLFQNEFIGYRYVSGQIIKITNEEEINCISKACETPYDKVNEHINSALRLMSDRDKPDYKNSIKESITAVETICTLIVGKKGSLRDLLKALEKNGVIIHPALKAAFEKLYGYTSDSNGIRHAGDLGTADATFEESEFMVVVSSAFINYLISLMGNNKVE